MSQPEQYRDPSSTGNVGKCFWRRLAHLAFQAIPVKTVPLEYEKWTIGQWSTVTKRLLFASPFDREKRHCKELCQQRELITGIQQ